MTDVHPFYRRKRAALIKPGTKRGTHESRFSKRMGKVTIEAVEEGEDNIVLARPTTLHGAAVQIKLNNSDGSWTGYAKIFVDGKPVTKEQKATVGPKFRTFLDQL